MGKKKTGGNGGAPPFHGPTGIRHGYAGEGEWNTNQKAKLRGASPQGSSLPQMRASSVTTADSRDMMPKAAYPDGHANVLGGGSGGRIQVGGTLPPSNSPPSTSFQARYNPGTGTAPSAPTPAPTPAATARPASVAAATRPRSTTPRAARPTATPATATPSTGAVSLEQNVARGGIDLRRSPSAPSLADTTTERLSAPISERETRGGSSSQPTPSRTSQARVPSDMSVATQPSRYDNHTGPSDSGDHTLRNIGIGAAVVGGLTLAATRSPRVAAMAARMAPAAGAAIRSVGPRIAAAAPGMARGAMRAIRSTAGRIFTREAGQGVVRNTLRTGAQIMAPELAGRGVQAATGSETAGNVARTAVAVGMGSSGGPPGIGNRAARAASGVVGSVALGEAGGALGSMIDRRTGDGRGHGAESLLRSTGSLVGAAGGSGAMRSVQVRRAANAAGLGAPRHMTLPAPSGPRSPTAQWEAGMMERAQRGTRMPPEGSASTDPRSRFDPANRPRGNNNPTVRPPPLPRATGPHITSSTIEASIPPEGGRTRSPSMNLPPQRTLPPEHQEAMAGLVNGLRSSNRGGGGTRRRLAAEPVSVQVQPARETPAPRSRRAPEVAAPASETAPLPAPETPAPVRTPRGHRGAAARAQASEMSSGHVEDPGIPRQSAPASFSPPAPGVTRSRAGMGPSAPSAVRNSNPIAEMAAQVTRAARSPLAPYSGGGRTSGESESARAARERVNGPRRREGFAGASGINHGAFSNAVGGGLVRGESNPTPIQSNHGFGRSNVKF